MNRRQKIIVSVVGIFIVLLALVGLTYAYFLTRVIGNGETKSISVTTASLQLVYANGSSSLIQEGTLISPNSDEPVGTKTFTVTNNGNGRVDNYGVFLEEFAVKYANDTVLDGVSIPAGTPTSFVSPNDLKLDIVCKAYDSDEYEASPTTAVSTDCTDMEVAYTTLPTSNDMLISNGIDVGVTHEYTVTLTYLETGNDQSDDMNKTIEGLIQIYGLNDVVDIEGTVTGANTGDYAQLNSEPKKSQIIDGKYKFTGVTPGNHTFSIFTKDGVLRGSKPITIKMGKVANTDNGIITITENSEKATIDITNISTNLSVNIGQTIVETETSSNPYKSGTLAYEIYKNADGVTDEEMATGVAKLSEPISIPGLSPSGYKITSFSESARKIGGGGLMISEDSRQLRVIYGTGYEFDTSTGLYKLTGVNSCIYSECYNELSGKYIDGNFYFPEVNLEKFSDFQSAGILEITSATYDTLNGILRNRTKTGVIVNEAILARTADNYTDLTGLESYYFRGNVKNNYVNYSGMCWRIVRIDGKSNVKLVLADENGKCNAESYSLENTTSAFVDGNVDIPYKEEITNTPNDLNFSSSNIPNVLLDWANKKSLDRSNLVNADWCFDASISRKEFTEDGSIYIPVDYDIPDDAAYKDKYEYQFVYGGLDRLSSTQPSNRCDFSGLDGSESIIYSNEFGLLTSDEIAFAGYALENASDGILADRNYLYYNSNIGFEERDVMQWTITPQDFYVVDDWDIYTSMHTIVNYPEGTLFIGGNFGDLSNGGAVRPSIVIKKDATIAAALDEAEYGLHGTYSNPYVIE